MADKINIGLIGAGMFGGDVHARTYADLQRSGISAQLARLGLDQWARELAPIRFELVAIATRTEDSGRRTALWPWTCTSGTIPTTGESGMPSKSRSANRSMGWHIWKSHWKFRRAHSSGPSGATHSVMSALIGWT